MQGITAQWPDGSPQAYSSLPRYTPSPIVVGRYGDPDEDSDCEPESPQDQRCDEASRRDVITPLANSGLELGGLHTATRLFVNQFGSGKQAITVPQVCEQLALPIADAHTMLAVLEVLEIIIPRGSAYKWRGTAHVSMLFASGKFTVGASVQQGVAVPKVCSNLIPHMVANEGVPVTAHQLADCIWDAQLEREEMMVEAEEQQRAALAKYVKDVLVVMSGLRYVELCPRANRELAFIFNPAAVANIISPKGQQQSRRMRNMRVLFDGPLPTSLDDEAIQGPAHRVAGSRPSSARPASGSSSSRGPSFTRPSTAAACGSAGNIAAADDARQLTPPTLECNFPPASTARNAHVVDGQSHTQRRTVLQEEADMHNPNLGRVAGRLQVRHVELPSVLEGDDVFVYDDSMQEQAKRSPIHKPGRNFAGVKQLKHMFETTRISQVAPFRVSKVKSIVRKYEVTRSNKH